MTLPPWLVRRLMYPLHERLRRRPTLQELQDLRRLAAGTPAELAATCRARLQRLLAFAAAHISYYGELFERFGLDPASPACAADPIAALRRLPVLLKRELRAAGDRLAWRAVPGGLRAHTSGGTSGDTLRFYVDRVRQAQDLAARLCMQGLFGVRPGDRRAHFWGSPIEGHTRLRRWRDWLLNERLLNAFELTPAALDRHLAHLRTFAPRVLYGYPSALALLAAHGRHHHRVPLIPGLRLVVVTGEEPAPGHVEEIRAAFACPVASEYGSREVGLIAHECPRGGVHVISPHVLVEVVTNGEPVPAGDCGEIVCTTLNARAQPFIRYRLGDVGRLLPTRCACGSALPLMQLEGGKVTGFIALPGGRLCHGAVTSHVLRDLPGIVEFKTLQHRIDDLEILLVVDRQFQADTLACIGQRYRTLFGTDLRVTCRILDQIPPDRSGKRRYVVSEVASGLSGATLAELRPEPAAAHSGDPL